MRALLCLLLLAALPLQAAERVVSLAPSMNEMMLELGAGERLVGILDGGLDLPELRALPRLGRSGQVEMETLIALQPDLVLLWPDSLGRDQREQLQRLGIELFWGQPRRLDELPALARALGARVGHRASAERLAAAVEERLRRLRQRYAGAPPLQVFYQVWDAPLYTLGGEQIISDALRVCGARNLFEELSLAAPQVSLEAVLARDPQVILVSEAHLLPAWQRWPQLRAVRDGHVWAVPDRGLERPSLQMLDATEALCALLDRAR